MSILEYNTLKLDGKQSSKLPGSPKSQACKIAVRLVKRQSPCSRRAFENKLKHIALFKFTWNLFFPSLLLNSMKLRENCVLNPSYAIFLITDLIVTVPTQITHFR